MKNTDRGLILAAFIMVLAMLTAPKIMGATYNFDYTYCQFGVNYDSLVYRVSVDGVTRDSAMYANSDTTTDGLIADTLSLDTDTTYLAEVRVYDGSWGDHGRLIIPARTASVSLSGSGGNTVVLYTVCGADAISGVNYTIKNSSGVSEAVPPVTGDTLTTVQLDNGTWEFIVKKAGYTGISTDSAISANDTLKFTLTADGSIAAPSSPSLANVYGYLLDIGGNAIEGAVVTCNVSFKGTAVDTTASKNIIWGGYSKGALPTDSTGRFLFQVLRSSEYSNTDSVFYRLSASYNKQTVFEAVRVYVPDTGAVNLGDTLANRI